ncbi:hypothetical protein [Leucothrix pacifica]|uniref:Uncharacterized protein n=1 Tax=Leucothrix pacifica TaxID=1247513 RepID=A0A317CH28_9GAMM|nr:hypothetical protein [Leucothrix pacifica]PWQ97865.1 hypothetical protein DKW60_09305 [Leucothrix pacifica]
MAGRNGLQRHQIILKQHNDKADYYVAWQAVFILRQFSVDEANRANITQDPAGFERTKAELATLHPSMQSGELDNFANHILGGIITQLRSVPVGILVDTYLFREYEELREIQEVVLTQQVHEYWAALNIDKSQFPQTIILANQHMNAAHAAMVDYQFPSPELTAPYKVAGMEAISVELLDLCLKHNSDGDQDKALIDEWAKRLNIQHLYRWV